MWSCSESQMLSRRKTIGRILLMFASVHNNESVRFPRTGSMIIQKRSLAYIPHSCLALVKFVSNNFVVCSSCMDHRNGQQHLGCSLLERITEKNKTNMGCPISSLAHYTSSETAGNVINVQELFASLYMRQLTCRCHFDYKTCKQHESYQSKLLDIK